MKKLSFVVSLPGENKYLREQAAVAKATAQRLGLNVHVMNAYSDAIVQSQQLLEIIQSSSAPLPDGIIIEPVNDTGLPRVAEAAAAAGIGWVISNARVDYLELLRKTSKAPVFAISQDHTEIGRMQGRQFAALLPGGGSVLYMRGPAANFLSSQRAAGMESVVPENMQVKTLKVQWTEESAYKSVCSWLRLSTVHAADIDLIAAQNIDFIMGARKAFQDQTEGAEQKNWLSLPYVGAGILNLVKPLVDQGVLAAAVIISTTVDIALEMLVRVLEHGSQPPEYNFVQASSYPELEAPAKGQRLPAGKPK